MAFGILEDRILPHVPGTVHLEEQRAQEAAAAQRTNLKHDGDIVLAPQPSDDPNDPLNWSFAKKNSIVAILLFGAFIIPATFGPLLSAGTVVISIDLQTSIQDVTILSGYQLLIAGAWGPFVSALSRKYGKRPQFLFASLIALIGTIICSASKDYNMLMTGRIVQGLSYPAYESLIFSTVADLFFVHQRGTYMSFFGFALAAVSNLVSVICGPITDTLGWHYLFHILDALVGFQLLLVFFFVPETAYERDAALDIDQNLDDTMTEKAGRVHVERVDENTGSAPSANTSIPPKKTFWQSLAIWTGSHSDENLLPLILAPVLVNLNLGAMWMVVVTGMLASFYVSQSYVAAQIFSFPPYSLSAAGVGYLFVGPFIGALLGTIILALIMDPLILWCTKHNKGVYEPEFRLIPSVLGILGGVGLFGYAAVVQAKQSLYLAAFVWGLDLFGELCLYTPLVISC